MLSGIEHATLAGTNNTEAGGGLGGLGGGGFGGDGGEGGATVTHCWLLLLELQDASVSDAEKPSMPAPVADRHAVPLLHEP
jgi:hypothetical protein